MVSTDELKEKIKEFYKYASSKLKIKEAPEVLFREDEKNAEDLYGKTGYYDPDNKKIVIYITSRHAKDIMRSFAHELVHHAQNEQGKFKKSMHKAVTEVGYAQKNKDLRKLEMDAFKRGNMIFRDYTDKIKMGETINESENKNMNKKLMVERVVKRVVERLKKLVEKKAAKDYDGDGKVESGTEEYLGSKDKAIKAAKAGKKGKKAAIKDAKQRTSATDPHSKKKLSESMEKYAEDKRPHAEEIVKQQAFLYEELLRKFNIK
jgi:hypothetical protein